MATTKGMSSIEAQVNKIFRHTRAGSYGTRARYRDSCLVFARYVAEEFKLQNIKNLSDKHLVSWVRARQDAGIAGKTIKNDLSAIRYAHDQVSQPKYEKLASNEELKEKYGLELEPTPQIKGNRAWTIDEYNSMLDLAHREEHGNVADVMTLCHGLGLRITEAVAVSRAQAEAALRTGIYQVCGEAKNGKWRQVPLRSAEAREVLQRRAQETERGGRLFIDVKGGEKTHEVANSIGEWIRDNRDCVTTDEGRDLRTWQDKSGREITEELTIHGLRYMYVQDRVAEEMDRGYTRDQAAAIVSPEVGHNRIDVINVYMAGN
jgi:site-specific recombinase XerC